MKEQELIDEFHKLFYRQWNIYKRKWMGVKIIKYPTDLFIYQMMIHRLKPDVILETGTYLGGGTLFFANMCDLVKHGKIISVDKRDFKRPEHKRIKYILGRTTSSETIKEIKKRIKGKTVMAVLDSDHTRGHVKRELIAYGELVTKGQYLVAEDTYLNHPIEKARFNPGPYEAVQWFIKRNRNYVIDHLEKQFLVSMCPSGFLRRVR